jgi:uroporphyrinogen decarboxylase
MNGRERFLGFLNRTPIDRPPMWIMRQAGRYLPEYRAVRSGVTDFHQLCYTPELASEVVMQPLQRFNLDAAIVFADILNVVDACGTEIVFGQSGGPCITKPIRSSRELDNLCFKKETLAPILQTISKLRIELPNHGVIGFVGSPWTLACYAVEGQITKELSQIKTLLYKEPLVLKQLLEHYCEAACWFVEEQIHAGADCIIIFDSWGGALGCDLFNEWSLQYQQTIMQAAKSHPVFLFTRNSYAYLDSILATKPNGICIDWTCPLPETLKRCQNQDVLLHGHFDPKLLHASDEVIQQTIRQTLDHIESHRHWLPSLGHGITPDIEPNKIKLFLDTLQQYHWNLAPLMTI